MFNKYSHAQSFETYYSGRLMELFLSSLACVYIYLPPFPSPFLCIESNISECTLLYAASCILTNWNRRDFVLDMFVTFLSFTQRYLVWNKNRSKSFGVLSLFQLLLSFPVAFDFDFFFSVITY